jgi:hypothetical protein
MIRARLCFEKLYPTRVLKTSRLLASCSGNLRLIPVLLGVLISAALSRSAESVMLTDVPDYTWYAGCFGTASGNLMGYWDRHGFPDFYTGPTAGGVAPLNSNEANRGIRSMWASRAGFDGRPENEPGHIDDYWSFYQDDLFKSYESTAPDPYLVAGRQEHPPDCIGDFIGLSQKKWANLNGECDGNIDAMSFVFWAGDGSKRVNFMPAQQGAVAVPDIPSGLRAWTRFRGYESDVFSQLTDFNPSVPPGSGFSFQDLRAEIDAGYPVLLFLQRYDQMFRSLPGMDRANPFIHGMLAYGYYVGDDGAEYVRYKTSWGSSGDNTLSRWSAIPWQANLPVRGVIGFRPLPRITSAVRAHNTFTVHWDGPSSVLSNTVFRTATRIHVYQLEKATRLDPPDFMPVSEPTTERSITLSDCCDDKAAFFRLRLDVIPQ